MTSSRSRIAPLYFFDQPTKRSRIKESRSNILYSNVTNKDALMDDAIGSGQESDKKKLESDKIPQMLSTETYDDDTLETSFEIIDHQDPIHSYKRAAPQLLDELALLLSRRNWTKSGRIPDGIVNILNYSWQDLIVGAVHLNSPEQTEKRGHFKSSPELDGAKSSHDSGGNEMRNTSVAGSITASARNPQAGSNPRKKKRKQITNTVHNSTTLSFSFPSDSSKYPGWIIQPKQTSCDDPQRISLCQWTAERLQETRDPEKLQTAEQDLNPLVFFRHYDDEKGQDRKARRKVQPTTLDDGMVQIPEVRQQDPARQKLLYKINNSSSFIYYPSGAMAVCQSHSGLPCGGFYTNVFSDSECPVILATITAFGHGTVTHPLSSAVSAVWDQDGGFMSDQHGNVTKEWSWHEYRTPREKIVIKVSALITVRLISGTSAMLRFRSDCESVRLPLSALPSNNQSKKTTKGKFQSDFAQDLLLTTKTKSPLVIVESETNLTHLQTSMVRESEELDEVEGVEKEEEVVEEPSTKWKRGGHVGSELKRLQLRVCNIVEDWLDYYRLAIGIRCPGVERMPDAPLKNRLRREIQSAVLPSLKPSEWADVKLVQPEDGRNELQKLQRHLSAQAERAPDSCVKLPRSVVIPNSPDLQPSAVPLHPAQPPFTPSIPLTVCPMLLRDELLGEGGRRRCCCCSATLMPALTDLEYDAFIMGQPLHSQQILVVCVTPPRQPVNTHRQQEQVVLEQLYRTRNKHRNMPCTQCQMDSFRLLRYEMSTRKPSCEEERLLLQQRHNVAPGMVLMYIRGKLLFVGYVFSDHSCSVRDLENQISRTRGDYRLSLSLPSDYKFSDTVNASAEKYEHNSQDETLKERTDVILTTSVEKEKVRERKNSRVVQESQQQQRDFCIKPKKTQTLPHIPVNTH